MKIPIWHFHPPSNTCLLGLRRFNRAPNWTLNSRSRGCFFFVFDTGCDAEVEGFETEVESCDAEVDGWDAEIDGGFSFSERRGAMEERDSVGSKDCALLFNFRFLFFIVLLSFFKFKVDDVTPIEGDPTLHPVPKKSAKGSYLFTT